MGLMIVAAISFSGLTGFAEDTRDFFAALRFARPALLGLLGLIPIMGLLEVWARRRRRSALDRIGRSATVRGQFTNAQPRRPFLIATYTFAWLFLILGIAGPLWGKSEETGIAVGRDVMIVIDLSRTMQADDMAARNAPKRWQAARNAALDLIEGMSRRGGHRVGVVVFAARSKLLCPLTTDYDHARAIVAEVDGEFPPPEIRPIAGTPALSGTRMGSALTAAVQAHDRRFPGYQDIILISDGDDPGEDEEWARGANAARSVGIPVHTVGVGNPDAGAFLFFNDEPLESRLQESLLKQLAAETNGEFIAARTASPALGEFFRTRIEPLPSREVSDEQLPLLRERYLWCLVPACVLFAICWYRGW